MTEVLKPDRLNISAVPPARAVPDMGQDMRSGLSQSPKVLHPKYFYDELGSRLFDQICDTPEYYPTRVESALLNKSAPEILRHSQPVNIIELGSGASHKSRLLLNVWNKPPKATYLPFDVSEEMLTSVAGQLADDYPDLHVHGLVGDYTAGLSHVPALEGQSLWVFIGSTLGNFEPDDAHHFVAEIAQKMAPGDSFLLGTDLHKSEDVLEAAYNDAQGLTGQFNLNILNAINQALDANFDLSAFSHLAYYCEGRRRIEMHLVSRARQQVSIGALELDVSFEKDERMRTEISRKFLPSDIQDLLGRAGLQLTQSYCDEQYPYALTLARKALA
ncbi:MAG: L-histidine N(alpha)-methyltransferase [Lysobacterales bacterium]